MLKVIAIPLASPIHGVEYIESLRKVFEKEFSAHGVELLEVIESPSAISKVIKEISTSIPILVFLTGGTSRIAREIISKTPLRAGLGIAHGEHNSLPSALSARARLSMEASTFVVLHCESPSKCSVAINDSIRIAKVIAKIKSMRIGLIGFSTKNPEHREFENVFGIEVVPITHDEVLEHASRYVNSPEIDKYIDILKSKLSIESIDQNAMAKILALYRGLKEIAESMSLDALTIDCFPFITKYGYTPCIPVALLNSEGLITACEADLRSLLLMRISYELTGKPGFILNPSLITSKGLIGAHCTVSLDMISGGTIVTHFESGRPYSIAGKLSEGVYTLAGMSYDYADIVATRVKVVENGSLAPYMCRTRVLLELEFPADKFVDVAVSNHHVLIPGDVRRYLKYIAEILGLEYIDYKDLAT